MSKVALVTDTHFGAHKCDDIYIESQLRFFRNDFIPYLKENNIDTIIHAGDFFDNRTNISVKILNIVYELFKKDLQGFKIFVLVGNHDTYHKSSINVNSLKFFDGLDDVTLIEDITEINIDGRDILLVPWQPDNKEFEKKISDTIIQCDICIGHFEILGFWMNKQIGCTEGIPKEFFWKNFLLTISGHFHKRSYDKWKDRTIQYIGNAYHLTRTDIGDNERGFCVLDTETLQYEFIDNKSSIKFIKLKFGEDPVIKSEIKGNIVDIHVDNITDENEKDYVKYLEDVEKCKPAKSPECFHTSVTKSMNKIEFKTQTHLELMKEYVDNLDETDLFNSSKTEILEKLTLLYNDHKHKI